VRLVDIDVQQLASGNAFLTPSRSIRDCLERSCLDFVRLADLDGLHAFQHALVVGIGFLFVPITAANYIGIPPEKGNSGSGLINFMRNIGGSIGTSVVTTMIAQRA
jgi:hypothetical protein